MSTVCDMKVSNSNSARDALNGSRNCHEDKRTSHGSKSSKSSNAFSVASGLEFQVFRELCKSIDSPRALCAFMLFEAGEHLQLVQLKCNPLHYTEDDVNSFEQDYLVTAFLSKHPDLATGIDTNEVAFSSWLKAEEMCRATNVRFHRYWSGEDSFPPDSFGLLSRARSEISRILGPFHLVDLSRRRFGPGADISTNGQNTSAYDKWCQPGSITPGALAFAREHSFDTLDSDECESAELVLGSRLAFVPKNAKTDRAIGVEPRWNQWFQLGLGDYIADRLRLEARQDIRDQNRNKRAASRALTAGLATIDLSSASDTISSSLVTHLLCGLHDDDDNLTPWYDALCALRCSRAEYKGRWYRLEKFSAMGNGFTFPLETLIFYALAKAVVSSGTGRVNDIQVYGDDIIVPQDDARRLIDLLSFCGFAVNEDKTFLSGLFFESCGSDYFNGKNVRPVYVKEGISHAQGAMGLANQIIEFARRTCGYMCADRLYFAAYRRCVSWVGKPLRLFGPLGIDGVFHAPFDFALPSRARRVDGYAGFTVKRLVVRPKRRVERDARAHLLSRLAMGASPRPDWVTPLYGAVPEFNRDGPSNRSIVGKSRYDVEASYEVTRRRLSVSANDISFAKTVVLNYEDFFWA